MKIRESKYCVNLKSQTAGSEKNLIGILVLFHGKQ